MTRRSSPSVSALVIALAAALLGAPFAGLIGNPCDHCPPQCPMHAGGKMRCHGGAGPGQNGPHARGGHCAPAAGIARPGCGHARQLPPIAIARAVLPPPTVAWYVPARALVRLSAPPVHSRSADPPESPPPILFS